MPSPSALLVLLGALALGRAWFGVLLVAAYGIGMAGTLVAGGLLLVRWRAGLERFAARHHSHRLDRMGRALPILTSLLVLGSGVFLAARAAAGL